MTTAVDGVEYTPGELDRDATFYVAGHRGLVGSAIVRRLESAGFENIVGSAHADFLVGDGGRGKREDCRREGEDDAAIGHSSSLLRGNGRRRGAARRAPIARD